MSIPKVHKKEKPDGVTYSQSFAAVIKKEGDKNKLIVKSQRWYQNQLNKFKNGEELTLMIHSRKPKRTEAQNRYYWGVFMKEIVNQTGELDTDRLHTLFKGKFLSEGVKVVLGEKVRKVGSSAALSVMDFSHFIVNIEDWTDVKAPPTENYGLESLDKYR
jgi:hypothetical protein